MKLPEEIEKRCMIVSSAICGDSDCDHLAKIYCDRDKERFKKEADELIKNHPNEKIKDSEWFKIIGSKSKLLFEPSINIPHVRFITRTPEFGNDVFSILGNVDDRNYEREWIHELL